MEPAITFSVLTGGILAADLLVDAAMAGAARIARHTRVGIPTRLIVGGITALVLATAAPRTSADAATPPPAFRLAEATAPVRPQVTDTPSAEPASHTVEPGDCLWSIARSLLVERGIEPDGRSITALWRAIYDLNRELIGDDPDLIHPGQALLLPGGAAHGA